MSLDNESLGAHYDNTMSSIDRSMHYAREAIKQNNPEIAIKKIKEADRYLDTHVGIFEVPDFPAFQNEAGSKIIGINQSHFKRIESLMRKINKVEAMIK